MTQDDKTPHLKISLGVSALVSVVAAVLTWGITWGVYSQRLAAAETVQSVMRQELLEVSATNGAQNVQIGVLSSQYTEILRRLESIDRKLEVKR